MEPDMERDLRQFLFDSSVKYEFMESNLAFKAYYA